MVEAIDSLDRAIGILQKEMSKNPAALAQVDTKNLDSMVKSLSAVINAASFTAQDQKNLAALVQSQQGAESDDEELGAPAAAVEATTRGQMSSIAVYGTDGSRFAPVGFSACCPL